MTKTATAPIVLDANNSVTPINQKPLRDALGVELVPGMRVEHVRTGEKATVLRLDLRSRRAVIRFDKVEGEPERPDTMRQAHLLKVRTHGGKVMMVKQAAKAAKK